jgi:hypothetical protein
VTYVYSCLWQKHQGHKRNKKLQVLLKDKSFPHLKSLFLNLFYISAIYDGGIKGCVWDPTSHKFITDKDI